MKLGENYTKIAYPFPGVDSENNLSEREKHLSFLLFTFLKIQSHDISVPTIYVHMCLFVHFYLYILFVHLICIQMYFIILKKERLDKYIISKSNVESLCFPFID